MIYVSKKCGVLLQKNIQKNKCIYLFCRSSMEDVRELPKEDDAAVETIEDYNEKHVDVVLPQDTAQQDHLRAILGESTRL